MPPTLGDRLVHIVAAIDTAREIIRSNSADELARNILARLALERALEIICEASRHVPDDIKSTKAEIDWRGIADLGNILRHAYHRVEIARLLKIARDDLPPLKAFVERVLAEEKKR